MIFRHYKTKRTKGLNPLSLVIFLSIGVIFWAGCESWLPAEPTPTGSIDDSPTLAPSPTFLPVIPAQSSDDFVGRSNPTMAGLAAEGQPTEEVTPPILPTEATIPITVITPDNLHLEAHYYGAPRQPAPVIVLVHGSDGKIGELGILGQHFQQAGYNVMLISLRGYGRSDGDQEWGKAVEDILAAFDTLQNFSNALEIGVIGIGEGGIAGAAACSQSSYCRAVILINPLLNPSIGSPAITVPALVLVGEDRLESLQIGEQLAAGGVALQRTPVVSLVEPTTASQLITWMLSYLPTPS